MGFLDNDTVVVDAILTKHGRKLLADGLPINPSHFALSDDGIDYSLWNTTSDSGSSGYDDYITNLPMIEAVPDDAALMKYKLISLPQNTQYMPIINLGVGAPSDHIYTITSEADTVEISPDTINFANSGEGYIFKISDVTPIVLTSYDDGANVVDMSGSPIDYPSQQNIATYVEVVNSTFIVVGAQGGLTSHYEVHILIEGLQSGAITTAKVKVQTT